MYSLLDVAKDGAADVVNIKVLPLMEEDNMTFDNGADNAADVVNIKVLTLNG